MPLPTFLCEPSNGAKMKQINLSLLQKQPLDMLLARKIGTCYTRKYPNLRTFHGSPTRRIVKPYFLADIGEGITECQIINWFVKPGDRVEQFDRICEVQSDKASVEITSRWDGTIKTLHYETDSMAKVGQPLLDIDIDAIEEATPPESAQREHEADQHELEALSQPHIVTTTDIPESLMPKKSSGLGTDITTPGVRHLLRSLDLEVRDIHGTGRGGRVSKEDIYRHVSATSCSSVTDVSPTPTSAPIASPGDLLVSLTPIQNSMFNIMTRSLTIPHFLYTQTVDITDLNSLRRRINGGSILKSTTSSKLTLLPFIMKALSQAFKEFPALNSHLDVKPATAPKLLIKTSQNFGVAVNTPQGLLVPVVKDVQKHSIASLASEITRLSTLAKEGKLGVDDFQGATFTVSNIGSIGGGVVSPVIVSPMVGILGVGRMRVVPGFGRDDQGREKIVKKEEIVLSWSADHRVLDGAIVAKCAERVADLLKEMEGLGVLLQ